jgi:hypothetical protein
LNTPKIEGFNSEKKTHFHAIPSGLLNMSAAEETTPPGHTWRGRANSSSTELQQLVGWMDLQQGQTLKSMVERYNLATSADYQQHFYPPLLAQHGETKALQTGLVPQGGHGQALPSHCEQGTIINWRAHKRGTSWWHYTRNMQ